MISGIHTALKHAIHVIVPPATALQDFTYHWKQLMNFYVNHLTDSKAPIQTTGIPRYLDRLLEILLEEEKHENDPGLCLEYLLQHKLLDLLATLAVAETPPGMRMACLNFVKKLLGRSKYPLLHHTSVYGPVQRLINLCYGNIPSPIEADEVQFLLTLCFLICKYPHVTNIMSETSPTVIANETPTHQSNSEKMEMEKVTYIPIRQRNNSNPLFQPLDTQAITLINPYLFGGKKVDGSNEQEIKSNEFTLSKDNESLPSSPAIQQLKDNDHSESPFQVNSTLQCHDALKNSQELFTETIGESSEEKHVNYFESSEISTRDFFHSSNPHDYTKNKSLSQSYVKPEKSKCLLLDALMSYLNSADNTIRVRACEGIMVLASLDDTSFVQTVINSGLSVTITRRLKNLFNAIPAHVDPNEIDQVEVTWGLDSPLWTNEKKFSGCRQVAAFFMWFDYCNHLIKEAHPAVAESVAKCIRIMFLEEMVTPALSYHHVLLITALITKCLKQSTSPILSAQMSYWLVGEHQDSDMPSLGTCPVLHRFIENCNTSSDDLILETLKLFEEVIEKRNHHILHCLILSYLSTRGYYDNGAADSAIASWSDEEDEREKKGAMDLSTEHNHSRTLAPSNIHRILNCFLSLVPRCLHTTSEANNHEKYMADWERQYSMVLSECSLMAWPLEAVSIDDCASSDSRPEADHCAARFYMGPFLKMLFDKVVNIPKQRYEINLQLTVVISKLALLPHPYLHEFLLNPLIPLVSSTKSLFTCLQKVVKQLVNEVPKVPNYKQILRNTRNILLENVTHEEEAENVLFESVVITEEFCKELAAIAYVKYQFSM